VVKRSLLVVAALVVPPLFAHDLWIEPSSFHPAVGDRLTIALRVGQDLDGEPMPRIPPLIERFTLAGIDVGGRSGADPAGVAVVAKPGSQWIAYQSKAYPVTLDAKKFEDYLREEGLERVIAVRKKRGQSAAPGRERFYRCAKSLLDVRGADAPLDVPIGQTLELVPLHMPQIDQVLPVALSFRGKPIADVLVVAIRKGAPERVVRARTDAKGRVVLRLTDPGVWLIKAVHMEAAPPNAGVDWESWWASMTFELRRP
jgi:uncharacterized GH25 family protein